MRVRSRARSAAAAVVVGIALLAVCAAAQAPTEEAEFTFTSSVRVPGAVLSPGMYHFVADRRGDGYVVHISGRDVDTRVVALPVARAETKGEMYRVFPGGSVGQPPTMRAWFRPGSLQGFLLAYPPDNARALARQSGTFALSTSATGNAQTLAMDNFHMFTGDGTEAPLTATLLRDKWDAPPLAVSPVK